jgi:hypothetical protein
MSSAAFPHETASGATAIGRSRPSILERLGRDASLVVILLVLEAALLVLVPNNFNVDTWLALVSGRHVWQSGIPHFVTLTAIPQGRQWVDQQWLSQLASYAAYRVGGLGLLGLIGATAFAGGIGAAVVAARRLGATTLSVLLLLPLAILLAYPGLEIRTQDFAVPLFVAVAYLVAVDARRPSRRVFWCLPLLVLWANLHGSATLGALLVGLHAVTLAWARRRELTGSVRALRRPVALLAGAGVSLMITPYGTGIVGYYRSTMLDSSLRHVITEWGPITSMPVVAGALAAVVVIALWAVWRHRARSTPWERLALLLLAAGSASVVRNAVFFGLFALIVVPFWIGHDAASRPLTPRRVALANGGLVCLGLVAVGIAAAVTMFGPSSTIEFRYQRAGVLTAVQHAAATDPSLRVMGDVRFDDWLLWRDPVLQGRMAYDGSYELLTPGQLDRLQNLFSRYGSNWKQFARGYRVVVLDRRYEPGTVRGFLAEPGRRILYDDGARIVLLRSATQAESR